MRVLHIYKTSRPTTFGGVETFIDTLCKADSKLGVINSVLTMNFEPEQNPLAMEGYTVYQAKQNLYVASTGFSLIAFKKFAELAQKNDIIHYHFPNPFADILHSICAPEKPSIVTYHSDVVRQQYLRLIYKPLQHRFLSSVDHIVATSPNYFSTSPVLQEHANKVSIIPIGVDQRMYEAASSERLEFWRNRLSTPFFLFVGALRYYKGLIFLLKAVAETDINIVIAGGNGIEDELKTYAASLSLNNVHFLGCISEEDKVALLHLCYCFIFPSHIRSEAFGVSILEAAMVGKPIISAEIGTGTSFVNIADKTGIVVKAGSTDELRSAMQSLLDNPDVALQMGKNAKKRAKKLFTAEKQAESYFKLYENLLSDRIVT